MLDNSGKASDLGSAIQLICGAGAKDSTSLLGAFPQGIKPTVMPGDPSDSTGNQSLVASFRSFLDPQGGSLKIDASSWGNLGKISQMWTDSKIGGDLASAYSNIQNDMGQIFQAISEVEALASELEQVWDLISTYAPIILAILAAL
jgi:hypothetical protein